MTPCPYCATDAHIILRTCKGCRLRDAARTPVRHRPKAWTEAQINSVDREAARLAAAGKL